MYSDYRINDAAREYWAQVEQDTGLEVQFVGGGHGLTSEPLEGRLTFFCWATREVNVEYTTLMPDMVPAGQEYDLLRALVNYNGALHDAYSQPADAQLICEDLPFLGSIEPGRVFLGFDARYINYLGNAEQYATFFDPLIERATDPESLAAWLAGAAEREREALSNYIRRTSMESVDTLVNEIGTLSSLFGNQQAGIVQTRHTLREKQQMLDVLMSARQTNEAEAAAAAWALIHKDERIESARFINNAVALNTIGLDLTHPETGRTVYLGKFRITINLDGGRITVQNLDNARGGFDHPHVHMNGPCFGEMGEAVHTLIRQGELYAAFEMMFVFLSSVNLQDDWGRRAVYWFTDEDELDCVINDIEEGGEYEQDYDEDRDPTYA